MKVVSAIEWKAFHNRRRRHKCRLFLLIKTKHRETVDITDRIWNEADILAAAPYMPLVIQIHSQHR